MSSPRLLTLCLGLVALGWGSSLFYLRAESAPRGDEATYAMMAQSLRFDRDLRYERQDILRANRLWDEGPAGVELVSRDGGETAFFGKSIVYPLLGIPFVALLGAPGLLVLNVALFLLMLGVALWLVREDGVPGGLFAVGFFFAAASLTAVMRMTPDVLGMACLFAALAIWRRGQPTAWPRQAAVLCGALLGLAGLIHGLMGLFACVVLADLLFQRRYQTALWLVTATVVTLALVFGLQRWLTGATFPEYARPRQVFAGQYPGESPKQLWIAEGPASPEAPAVEKLPHLERRPRVLVRKAWYFLAGRHIGLLAYFPFALFAIGLYVFGPRARAQNLLFLGVTAACTVMLLTGEPSFAGLYAVFFFLPQRIPAALGLLLPFLAAGLWTMTAVTSPAASAGAPTFQWLPLELTLLPQGQLPDYEAQTWGESMWISPRRNIFPAQPGAPGFWVRGGSRSEIVVVSPRPLDALRFTVASRSAENILTLKTPAGVTLVRFDSAGKQEGARVEIPLRVKARDLGGFFPAGEYYYDLMLTTSDGHVPARSRRHNGDRRNLGVYLSFEE